MIWKDNLKSLVGDDAFTVKFHSLNQTEQECVLEEKGDFRGTNDGSHNHLWQSKRENFECKSSAWSHLLWVKPGQKVL